MHANQYSNPIEVNNGKAEVETNLGKNRCADLHDLSNIHHKILLGLMGKVLFHFRRPCIENGKSG